ncbi:MAG: InlB B-repeat-containing protein [Paludibacteraceae bacterium]|nr:InlB B-repeat-containing protein [Paludibacteraceae bacterium]
MKKIFLYIAITLGLLSCNHKDSLWQEVVEDLDERVETLEMLCAEMNTNITALQTIVDVLQSNDFITSIVEIKKDGKVVGYTITFGKHDPITIYHGQDGKDGQNGTNGKDGQDGADGKDGQNGADGKDGKDGQDGADGSNGQDGITPQLKIENGYWYVSYDNGATWTQFGKATGADGQDGQNGTDGKDGQDGKDGKDGVTPQLKIEEGYWFISYNNGATWTQLGKATGEDGKDGANGADGKDGQDGTNGKDGQDGDSMFQSVTQDENYVYFTLADGTVIKIAKGNGDTQSNNDFIFTITYDANGGVGTMQPDTFYYGVLKMLTKVKFTKSNYDFINWNTKADGSGITYENEQTLMISKNIKLYAQWGSILSTGVDNGYEWVDLGLSVRWATRNVGASSPEKDGSYFSWGEVTTKTSYSWSNYKWCRAGYEEELMKYCSNKNYGYNDFVDNLTRIQLEDDAAYANCGKNWRIPTKEEFEELINKCTWVWTTQNGRKGYKISSKSNENFIFLPASGSIDNNTLYSLNSIGDYWSSSLNGSYPNKAYYLHFNSLNIYVDNYSRYVGASIRPVLP